MVYGRVVLDTIIISNYSKIFLKILNKYFEFGKKISLFYAGIQLIHFLGGIEDTGASFQFQSKASLWVTDHSAAKSDKNRR